MPPVTPLLVPGGGTRPFVPAARPPRGRIVPGNSCDSTPPTTPGTTPPRPAGGKLPPPLVVFSSPSIARIVASRSAAVVLASL